MKGEIYIKKENVPELQRLFQNIEQQMKIPSGQIVAVDTNKFPTNYVINSYTASAQEIVETYGIPRYKEANPSFFTTVTFPFLFGVMFGDIAHGTILFCFGTYLCFYGDTIRSGPLKLIVPHRYLFTLMGFFATYCGFIYNDFLSISLDLFGSCYDPNAVNAKHPEMHRFSTECVYGVGIDPAWAVSSN